VEHPAAPPTHADAGRRHRLALLVTAALTSIQCALHLAAPDLNWMLTA
jgi:hypothetical protein